MSDTKGFDFQGADIEKKLEVMSVQDIEKEISLLVKAVKESLIARGEMMATAESCTGGLVASSIVNEAGSSAVLAGGIVAYQNEIKEKLLGVRHETLEQFGAVSEQTVREMAAGAIRQFGCQWAVSTSGIAGPGGAEPGKPVGTVWMSISWISGNNCLQNESFCKIFAGDRLKIRVQTVYIVLGKLIFLINNQKSTCTSEH